MFVIAVPKGAQPQQMTTKSLAAETGPGGAIFQGYDSVTGQARATAVSGGSQGQGATSAVICKVCSDLETLAKTVDISQSLSVSYGPIGSVSEKTDFVSSLNVTTYSVSIVVYAQHVNGTEQMTTVTPNSGISTPTDNASRQQFFVRYGDSFVSSRTLGGEYIAVYTFYSRSRQEQDTLTAEMQAHGLLEGVNVDASLQTKIQNFSSSTQTRSVFSQMISGIKNPSLPSSDGIINFALQFPSLPLDAPTIISFQTTGYEHVFGSFGDIPKNRAYFVGTGVIDGLTKYLIAVRQLLAQIGWLSSIYQFYGYSGDSKLGTTAADARTDLNAINAQMQAWESDPEPSSGFTLPALKTANAGTPSLSYTVHYDNSHGGGGGDPFNDVSPSTYLQLQTRITSIQLRSGDVTDCLMTSFTDSTGRQWTSTHGGGGGSPSATLPMMAGEFVSGVDGRSGEYVDQLNLTSSGGARIGGGGGGGSPYTWGVPGNSVMLGFAGRSGRFLDQVQVIYATFAPAKWA